MFNVGYFPGGEEFLADVKPLWEQTRDFHSDVSLYFSSKFGQQNFNARKAGLQEKSLQGKIRIILAKDLDCDKYIGYCVSIIDREDIGEIDSLFVEPFYRKNGIAENLMKMALNWMDEECVKTKKLSIAVGNESVLEFYKKFNFYPYQIILEKKD